MMILKYHVQKLMRIAIYQKNYVHQLVKLCAKNLFEGTFSTSDMYRTSFSYSTSSNEGISAVRDSDSI